MEIKLLVDKINELVTPVDEGMPLSGKKQGNIQIIRNAAIAIDESGTIVNFGERRKVLDEINITPYTYILEAENRTVIPGFVDPHTHVVYAGCRHWELEERLKGTPYLDILKRGGGINDTVKKTRETDAAELVNLSLSRLHIMFSYGTTTVEIKSGYGLSVKEEHKILEVIAELRKKARQDIISTFLGAHAIPPEFRDSKDKYVKMIVENMLPNFTGMAEFCDVFVEDGAFTYEDGKKILQKAKELGYKLKIHADEITSARGAELAGELQAVSADHLIYPSDRGLELMRANNTIAVILPATSFFLRSQKSAPVKRLMQSDIPIAMGTDHNPGTSPLYSQQFNLLLSVFSLGLTPAEALVSVTLNAAYAIDRGNITGSIKEGKKADLLILNTPSYIHLFYEMGHNLIEKVIKNGAIYEFGRFEH